MSKKTSENFYTDLNQVLIEEVLFYIPSSFISNEILDTYKEFEVEKYLDKLFVFDKQLGLIYYDSEKFSIKNLLKRAVLDKNIFQLFGKKRVTEANEFNYLLEKYFTQVQFHYITSEWFYMNVNQYMSIKVDDELIQNLLLQFENIKAHKKDVYKNFLSAKKHMSDVDSSLPELIKEHIDNLIENIQKKEQQAPIELNQSNFRIDNTEVKKDKKLLITKSAAEEFLLTSVFNIKL